MPTIKGLRRRGYTSEILNAFCLDIGVTRNENVIQYERLQYWARAMLNESSKRAMGVMDAVKVHITNLEAPLELEVCVCVYVCVCVCVCVDLHECREQSSSSC